MALQKVPGRAIQLDDQANSDIMYFDGTNWVRLAKGEAGEVLKVNEFGTFPVWGLGYSLQGGQYGYMMGSNADASPFNLIDRFSFTSQSNAVAVGSMLTGTHANTSSGSSSASHGYSAGHINITSTAWSNTIQKVSFASAEADSTDVADLTLARNKAGGATAFTQQFGYCYGGHHTSPSSTDVIDKYAFATDSDATNVGDLTEPQVYYTGGSNSLTHGYRAGGYVNTPNGGSEVIDKWSFATDGDATDVGNLLGVYMHVGAGFSSPTHGYTYGQYQPGAPQALTNIEKYSFATDGNSTDVGDMTVGRYLAGGVSATDHGYIQGGVNSTGQAVNIIERVAHATDTNAVDWADLTVGKKAGAGVQY
jgi:hypothetical protein